MSDIEAVLLTGGASSRMGEDKATLVIDGEAQGMRIARALATFGVPVTVLGREPLGGLPFLHDAEQFAGPLSALSRFQPKAEFVFVASCDLPLFDGALVGLLRGRIGGSLAAAPHIDGWNQPLCALYRGEAFFVAVEMAAEGYRCPSKWLARLAPVLIDEQVLLGAGLDPMCAQGANTPDELTSALNRASS